jgi:chromosomal replication initiation ATPase DnaA
LPLALPVVPRFGAADLVEGDANAAAIAHLARWPDWPSPVVLLIGPEASGKSHLAALWLARSGGTEIVAAELAAADPLALAQHPAVLVEDTGAGVDERALFHLVNAVRSAGSTLLVTARTPPAEWGLAVPDLVSRLRAATPLILDEPDDALLEAVLGKLFADRQTIVDPAVLTYVARRMERSYAAARALVEALDREALASKAPITRAVALRVLGERFTREPELPGLDAAESEGDDNSVDNFRTGENNLS